MIPQYVLAAGKKNISWEKPLPANETKKSSKDITWRLLLWLSYYSVCIDILLVARVRNRELIAGVLWALAACLAKKRLIKSKNTVKHTTIKIRANKAYRVSCNITFAMNFHRSSPITRHTFSVKSWKRLSKFRDLTFDVELITCENIHNNVESDGNARRSVLRYPTKKTI